MVTIRHADMEHEEGRLVEATTEQMLPKLLYISVFATIVPIRVDNREERKTLRYTTLSKSSSE